MIYWRHNQTKSHFCIDLIKRRLKNFISHFPNSKIFRITILWLDQIFPNKGKRILIFLGQYIECPTLRKYLTNYWFQLDILQVFLTEHSVYSLSVSTYRTSLSIHFRKTTINLAF
jgi:hypothetical protein